MAIKLTITSTRPSVETPFFEYPQNFIIEIEEHEGCLQSVFSYPTPTTEVWETIWENYDIYDRFYTISSCFVLLKQLRDPYNTANGITVEDSTSEQ